MAVRRQKVKGHPPCTHARAQEEGMLGCQPHRKPGTSTSIPTSGTTPLREVVLVDDNSSREDSPTSLIQLVHAVDDPIDL